MIPVEHGANNRAGSLVECRGAFLNLAADTCGKRVQPCRSRSHSGAVSRGRAARLRQHLSQPIWHGQAPWAPAITQAASLKHPHSGI